MGNGECGTKPHLRVAPPFWICLGLVLVPALVYGRVAGFDFVNFDDPTYVLDNSMVSRGLSLESVRWAFTTFEFANWHPLTWLSYLVDCQVFGLRPGPMHVENLVFHLANTVLVFLLLERMTKTLWPSVTVAALFALHPLHVESVAWISERKDVLSTLFGLLAISAYERGFVLGSKPRLVAAIGWYALSLLAKPMLVTLPVLLLLLHVWPLKRRPFEAAGVGRLWMAGEWGALLLLAALSSFMTLIAQGQAGAIARLDYLPLDVRVANAALAYLTYLMNAIVPIGLACPYPHPYVTGRTAHILWPFYLETAVAAVLFGIICWGALALRRRYPYVLVGWLWYVVSLLPVIGIVQVGRQAMADRYMYLPSIGLFIVFAWGAADLLRALHWRPVIGRLAAVACLVGCCLLTWRQVGFWQDSITLFERTLAVTTGNDIAQTNLSGAYHLRGDQLAQQGDWNSAEVQYRAALDVLPYWAEAMNDLATALVAQGKFDEAQTLFERILHRFPDYPEAHYNWGLLFAKRGHTAEAADQFQRVLEHKPTAIEAELGLSLLLAAEGKTQAAAEHYVLALRNESSFRAASPKVQTAFANIRPLVEAQQQLDAASRAEPHNEALQALARFVSSLRALSPK